MKKNVVITFTLIFAFGCVQGYAFGGQKKGLIVGGGVGGGFLSNKFTLGPDSNTASPVAILAEFKIGLAASSSLEIHLITKAYFWQETFFEASFFEDKGTAVLALNACGHHKVSQHIWNWSIRSGRLGPSNF